MEALIKTTIPQTALTVVDSSIKTDNLAPVSIILVTIFYFILNDIWSTILVEENLE